MCTNSEIQRQIVEAVKWRGAKAVQLAKVLGVHRSVAHRLISGNQDMRISTLERLAAALGYEVQLVNIASRERIASNMQTAALTEQDITPHAAELLQLTHSIEPHRKEDAGA